MGVREFTELINKNTILNGQFFDSLIFITDNGNVSTNSLPNTKWISLCESAIDSSVEPLLITIVTNIIERIIEDTLLFIEDNNNKITIIEILHGLKLFPYAESNSGITLVGIRKYPYSQSSISVLTAHFEKLLTNISEKTNYNDKFDNEDLFEDIPVIMNLEIFDSLLKNKYNHLIFTKKASMTLQYVVEYLVRNFLENAKFLQKHASHELILPEDVCLALYLKQYQWLIPEYKPKQLTKIDMKLPVVNNHIENREKKIYTYEETIEKSKGS